MEEGETSSEEMDKFLNSEDDDDLLPTSTGEIYKIQWNGGSYVGQTRGRAINRWNAHLQRLIFKCHHNKELQKAYDMEGICGLSFQVLESGVEYPYLDDREDYWTLRLESVNARPKIPIKKERTMRIIKRLRQGKTYREISSEMCVSLGTIGNINKRYRVLPPRGLRK